MEHQPPQHEHHHQPEDEHSPGLRPRIYLADLAAYVHGELRGTWADATLDPAELHDAAQAMLADSPVPGAEEIAVHDTDEFGCIHLHEYEDLDTVSRLANGLAEHGCGFGHWADYVGNDPDELDRFEEVYRGRWESLSDYARDLLDDLGVEDQIERALPDWIQPYVTIDYEALGRDIAIESYVVEDGGGVWVYEP